jgi:hypothetical protein
MWVTIALEIVSLEYTRWLGYDFKGERCRFSTPHPTPPTYFTASLPPLASLTAPRVRYSYLCTPL